MALCLVVLCVAIAGCKAKHEHKFAEGWTYDETGHWHVCTGEGCQETEGFAAHVWDEGAITTEATFVNDGVKTYTCTVCAKTRTESVAFECAEVPFEKSTVADKTYATVTITDDTIGTYYFKYNVSDVSMERSESYWIVVNKAGGGLTRTTLTTARFTTRTNKR